MSEYQSKYQHGRPNRHKPSVVKNGGFWWARVWTPDNLQFLNSLHKSQPEALGKAYELAARNEGATS